jgi:hypothetical protein
MNFRAQAEMLVLFPKRILAVWKDNTMPKIDWSKYDSPPDQVRRANVAKLKLDRVRKGR